MRPPVGRGVGAHHGHGLHYGTGVLKGCARTRRRTVRRFSVSTLRCGALPPQGRGYGVDLRYSFEQLCAASTEVIKANKLENAYLRPLALDDSQSFSVWPKGCPISVTAIAVPGKPDIPGGPSREFVSPCRASVALTPSSAAVVKRAVTR